MSETITTLQDTNFIADINFVSVDRESGESTYLPIDLASVSYFEINDNLIDFGLTGNITFPNWGQLLGKLNLLGGQGSSKKKARGSNEQYITINLKDADLPINDPGYDFIASAKSSSSLVANAVDVKQTLDFEEDVTASLKKISWEIFLDIQKPNEDDKPTSFSKLIVDTLNIATEDRAEIAEEVEELDERSSYNLLSLNIFQDNEASSSKSIYAIIQDGVNHLTFDNRFNPRTIENQNKPVDEKRASLPLLKTVARERTQEEGFGPGAISIRKLTLGELLTKKHIEFIDAYKTDNSFNITNITYDDVYMEEFAIAPTDSTNSTNSSIHNSVEQYDLIQPDINNLRQTTWGTYEIINSTIDIQKVEPIQFNELANDFEQNVLAGNSSNLPSIPYEEAKLFKIFNIAGKNQKGKRLVKANLRNIIYKSFIYLNETIVLNVKGKLYRKPGKFITIKGDMCTNRAEELWYVIEVKHKFENGNYRNEIKAVRFLADGNEKNPRNVVEIAKPSSAEVVFRSATVPPSVFRPVTPTNNVPRLENAGDPPTSSLFPTPPGATPTDPPVGPRIVNPNLPGDRSLN